MRPPHYRLVPGTHEVEPCSLMEWAVWWSTADRRVAEHRFEGAVRVTTEFLGLDCRIDDGPPLFFETMIIGGAHDGYKCRYSTWNEAVNGHDRACQIVEGTLTPT